MKKDSGSMKRNRLIGNTITYIVLILMSIIWLFPFFVHHPETFFPG